MFIKRMKLICKTQGRGGAKGDLRSQHDPPALAPGQGRRCRPHQDSSARHSLRHPQTFRGLGSVLLKHTVWAGTAATAPPPRPWDSGALRSAQLQHGLLTHGMRWNLVKRQTWSGPEILHF